MSDLVGTAARTPAERAHYGEAAHLAWHATRPDVLDVVLTRSAPLRGLLGLEVPA